MGRGDGGKKLELLGVGVGVMVMLCGIFFDIL